MSDIQYPSFNDREFDLVKKLTNNTAFIAENGAGGGTDSPHFTGIPTAPTAANGTNTTQLATTAFVLANGTLPTQAGNSGKVLSTDGALASWIALPGGGNVNAAATLVSNALVVGGGAAAVSTVSTASGFLAFAATPSSTNLRALMTDESGTGALLFAGGNGGAFSATSLNGNTFTTGTYTLTGAAGKTLTFSNTLTLTGTDSSSVNFGAGGTVLYSGGAYVASLAGTANEITASAATGAVTISLPSALTFTGKTITGGTFSSPALTTPALGTPASGIVTNLTGTASININGTVGATTPSTGAFTTFSATLINTFTGASVRIGTAVSGNAIDVAKGMNTHSVSSNVTVTFTGSPSTRQWFGYEVTADSTARTITLPANVFPLGSSSALASFIVPASSTLIVYFIYDGTNYRIINNPALTSGSGSTYALTTSPVFTTPNLGVPSSLTLTNATGLPIAGISATGTPSSTTFLRGDGTWNTPAGGGNVSNTGTPTSGQAAEWTSATVVQGVAVTGTGSYVKATSASLVTPNLGTPSAIVLTNATGLVASTGTTASGTPSSTTFLRGDNTWATPSGAGNVTAGGTLTSNAIVLGGGSQAISTTAGFTTDGTSILTLGVAGTSVGTVAFKNATSGTASLLPPTGALGTYSITLPNAASVLPVYTYQATFVGPTAARTITYPDANFTVARTDAANTFTGTQTGTFSLGSASVATTQAAGDNSTKVATTAYVQTAISQGPAKEASKYATTAALATVVYSNGASGVGATLTAVGLGAISIDGSTPSVGDRLLVKNQASTFQNGIYTVTTVGNAGVAFVLTRATDFNQSFEIETGASTFVTSGTTNGSTTWDVNSADSPVMGTDAITFVQTAGPGSITSGNGITVTGASVAIDTSVTVDKTTAQTLTNKSIVATQITAGAFPVGVTPSTSGTITTTDVGFRGVPQQSQSAAYTTVMQDAGKCLFHPVGDANARTFTIDSNANVAYPIGTVMEFLNMSASAVTIAITSDTLTLLPAGTTGSRTLAQYGRASVEKITSTSWIISGNSALT